MLGHVTLRGQNPTASTTAQPVWGVTSTQYVQLLTGTALGIISSSANDAAAGTGAQTVLVNAIDGNYDPVSEIISPVGVTETPLVNTSLIAVNSTKVLTAGSGLTNAGNIDIRAISGDLIKSRIQSAVTAVGQSQDFIYTMPRRQYGLMRKIQFYAYTSTGSLIINLYNYDYLGVQQTLATASHSLDVTAFASGEIVMDFGKGLYIPPKSLTVLVVDVTAGTPLVSAIGEMDIHSA